MNLLEVSPTDLNYALKQDQNDPLAHFRERFHLPKTDSGDPFIYFCGVGHHFPPTCYNSKIADFPFFGKKAFLDLNQ